MSDSIYKKLINSHGMYKDWLTALSRSGSYTIKAASSLNAKEVCHV